MSALQERDAELEELTEVVQTAASGAGGTVLVEGAAGVGKTALLSEVSAIARRAGARVFHARGSDLERDSAFGVIRQLFEPRLMEADPTERRSLLAGAAAPAERAILPTAGEARGGASDTSVVLHGLYQLVAALLAVSPLVLSVDDAHWADISSLRVLSYFAGRLLDLPLAIVVTFRPNEPGAPESLLDRLRAEPGVRRLTPAALTGDGVASMVRTRDPGASGEVCAAISSETEGNPLLIEELLREVSGANGLTGSEAVSQVRSASIQMLGDRVARRIEPQGPDAPGLAKAMAVLGDGAGLGMAASLARVPLAQAGEVAHRLRAIEVLRTEDPVSFVHPLIRRSVYDTLSVPQRSDLHASAARLLAETGAPAEDVATHLAIVAPAGSNAAAAALLAAGRAALYRGAPDEAVPWLQRALTEGAEEPAKAEILTELGMTQALLRDTASVATLSEALELALEPQLRTRITATLAEILVQSGQWERGAEVIAAAEEELRVAHPDLAAELETEVAALQAVVMAYDPAMVDEFEGRRDELAELARGRTGWHARALEAVLAAVASHRGESAEKVLVLADRALGDGTLLAERAGGWAAIQAISALVQIEHEARALQVADEALAAGQRDGSLMGLLTGHDSRGWIYARRGDFAAAEVEMRSALELTSQVDNPMADLTALNGLQDAILERPRLGDLAGIAEGMHLDPPFDATMSGAYLAMVRGRIRVTAGDDVAGVRDLRRALEIYSALRLGPWVAPARSLLALALPLSERDEALRLANEELEMATAAGFDRPLGVAKRAVGVLEGGESGIQLLRASADLLERTGARYEHARSLVELGAALRRAHQRNEAQSALSQGMELADRCGADRLVSRAREELVVAGSRPRRAASTGPAALTASERRVAELAVRGATNTAIARELVLSLKTVETHLSSSYAKLDIAGPGARGRLPEALAESG